MLYPIKIRLTRKISTKQQQNTYHTEMRKPKNFKKGMQFLTALRSFLIKAMGLRFKPLENLTTMQTQNYNPENKQPKNPQTR